MNQINEVRIIGEIFDYRFLFYVPPIVAITENLTFQKRIFLIIF